MGDSQTSGASRVTWYLSDSSDSTQLNLQLPFWGLVFGSVSSCHWAAASVQLKAWPILWPSTQNPSHPASHPSAKFSSKVKPSTSKQLVFLHFQTESHSSWLRLPDLKQQEEAFSSTLEIWHSVFGRKPSPRRSWSDRGAWKEFIPAFPTGGFASSLAKRPFAKTASSWGVLVPGSFGRLLTPIGSSPLFGTRAEVDGRQRSSLDLSKSSFRPDGPQISKKESWKTARITKNLLKNQSVFALGQAATRKNIEIFSFWSSTTSAATTSAPRAMLPVSQIPAQQYIRSNVRQSQCPEAIRSHRPTSTPQLLIARGQTNKNR